MIEDFKLQEENIGRIITDNIALMTRHGLKAYVLVDGRSVPEYKGDRPLFGFVIRPDGGCNKESWRVDGRTWSHQVGRCDIVGLWKDPHPLTDLPIDTPVVVYDSPNDHKYIRRLHKANNGWILVYPDGESSQTSRNPLELERWKFGEILK